jgi:hypothetical protein
VSVAWLGCELVLASRFTGLPGGSEQWVRYRVLYTAPGGAEVASEWGVQASCTVARADLRAAGLLSVEAFTLDAVLDSHADMVTSLPCAGFEVQRAASRAGLATAAPLRVGSPPAGQATAAHRFVVGRGGPWWAGVGPGFVFCGAVWWFGSCDARVWLHLGLYGSVWCV